MHRIKRTLFIVTCSTCVVVAIGVRAYFEYVPRGAAFIPFTGHSHELPAITSPNGASYRVFVNDAGAMHSGNYWTWVVGHHWLTGRYVVTEGYISTEYSTGDSDLVVNWNADIPVIDFEDGRY